MTAQMSVSGPHPDLLQIVCDAVNQVALQPDLPEAMRLSAPLRPEHVMIRCQRVWHNIRAINPRLNGGSFAGCVAQFEDRGNLFSYFVEAARPADGDAWHWAGASGGQRPPELRERASGCMIASGSHVCVGGLGIAPEGGALRVELADGSVYEDTVVDGCAIVFAPVTTPPNPGDHAAVRAISPDGAELSADRVWLGDGTSPPPR
jgi:hypothetical protein